MLPRMAGRCCGLILSAMTGIAERDIMWGMLQKPIPAGGERVAHFAATPGGWWRLPVRCAFSPLVIFTVATPPGHPERQVGFVRRMSSWCLATTWIAVQIHAWSLTT